jgi:NADH dehydrogenase
MISEQPRIVIVGGGFGGLYAAKALSEAKVQITLVDRRNHHLFQPLLYQVATAGLSPGDIACPIRAILRRQNNTRIILAEAVKVDPEGRRLILQDGVLQYDYLILATGCSHSYFGHEDWESVAPGLKSLEDALEIRRRILLAFEKAERETQAARRIALLTFVIVGGGPTGVELAGAIDQGALATIGRAAAVADFGKIRLSGPLAWLVWLLVHIFFLIGFRNRFIVLFEWAWAYLTFQRGARLITGDIDSTARKKGMPPKNI